MKYIAIEREVTPVPEHVKANILRLEALKVKELMSNGIVLEIFFNQAHCAVLILEGSDISAVLKALNTLPLVSEKYISFEIHELRPYDGFERI